MKQSDYTIRRSGDNYALCFKGSVVESGIFATRKTAEKHKRIAEQDRQARLQRKPKTWTVTFGQSRRVCYTWYHAEQLMEALRANGTECQLTIS